MTVRFSPPPRVALGPVQRGLDRMPGASASADDLLRLLDAQRPRLADGGVIARGEAAWLQELVHHPNADARVQTAVRNLVQQLGLTGAAERAGAADAFELGASGDATPPIPTGGTGPTALDVQLGGGDVPTLGATSFAFGRPQRGLPPLPAAADRAALATALDAATPKLTDAGLLAKGELAWLQRLVRHPAADGALIQDALARVDGLALSRAASASGGADFLASLRAATTFAPDLGAPEAELGPIPTDADRAGLEAFLDRVWRDVEDRGTVTRAELAWLQAALATPAADASLKERVADRLAKLKPGGVDFDATLAAFVDALRDGRTIAAPTPLEEPPPRLAPDLGRPARDLPRPDDSLSATALAALFDQHRDRVFDDGGQGQIAKGEVAWILSLAQHPNADVPLRRMLAARLRHASFTPAAEAAGASDALALLATGAKPIGKEEVQLSVDAALTAAGRIRALLTSAANDDGEITADAVDTATAPLEGDARVAVDRFYSSLTARHGRGPLTVDDVVAGWTEAVRELKAADPDHNGFTRSEMLYAGALGAAALDLGVALAQHRVDSGPYAGLSGDDLRVAIAQHAAPNLVLGYREARQELFGFVDNHGGWVEGVYTGRRVQTSTIPDADAGPRMNTEHTRPQSRGVRGTPARSDLHHLFPSDTFTNGKRGSYPFGEVKTVAWENGDARLGWDEAGRMVFEPPDDHKGNVARALFYVSAVYDLPLPDAEEKVLQAWSDLDDVDDAERLRNDRVEQVQGNRNPFVDDADLSDRIDDF